MGVSDDDSLLEQLPLFPLQAVLFPGGMLGLKVFEARYLDLVSECLRLQQPFGVICLKQGGETQRHAGTVALEGVGVLATIEEVDAEQQGILNVRCIGSQRFRRSAPLVQRENGLWVSEVQLIEDDSAQMPGPAMLPTVRALAGAIKSLAEQGKEPFAQPFRLDHAGWVANRWCELLPISLAAKQKLMELEDPVIRLSLVDGFLRDKKVVTG